MEHKTHTKLREIKKRFFEGRPVQVCEKFEGQGITPDLCYQLGLKAGPSLEINNLLHEMSHLAERETEKLVEFPYNSWGFSFGKYWELGGQSGFEPQTDQATLRETRVWSYQLAISRELGVEESAQKLVSAAVDLSDFYLFKWRRLKGEQKKGYKEQEGLALELLAKMVEEGTEEYTYENFLENWNAKLQAISTKRTKLLEKGITADTL